MGIGRSRTRALPPRAEGHELDVECVRKVYRRYARSHDFWFGWLLEPGRRLFGQRLASYNGTGL